MKTISTVCSLIFVGFLFPVFLFAQISMDSLSEGQKILWEDCLKKKERYGSRASQFDCECLTERYPEIVEALHQQSRDDIARRGDRRLIMLERECEQGNMVVLIKDSARSVANPNGEVRLVYRYAKHYPSDDYPKISACDALEERKKRMATETWPDPHVSRIWLYIEKHEVCY